MAILVRRSNLMVPVTDAEMVKHAWRHEADAVTLDLENGVVAARKAEARGLVKDAIAPIGQGAAEVFVRVNKSFLQADLEASVCRRRPQARRRQPDRLCAARRGLQPQETI